MSHNKVKYKCPNCGIILKFKDNNQELKELTEYGIGEYYCPKCKETFKCYPLEDNLYNKLRSIAKYRKKGFSIDKFINQFIEKSVKLKMLCMREPFFVFHENMNQIISISAALKSMKKKQIIMKKIKFFKPSKELKKICKKIENIDLKFFDKEKYLELKENKSKFLNGEDIIDVSYYFIIPLLVTNIEVYLEDKIKGILINNKSTFENFIKEIKEEDWPKRWRKNRYKITPSDHYLKMKEIIFDELLSFPYHQIDGRTNHIFKNALKLDLMSFLKKDLILKLIDLRHTIIHRFKSPFKIQPSISEKELNQYINVTYEFIFWIEKNLKKYNINLTLSL